MATQVPARTAQRTLVGSYLFNLGDTISDGNLPGGAVTFVSGLAGTQVIPAIKIPKGTRVVGGALTVQTAFNDSGTQTISVGDSNSAARYLGNTSVKSTGRTALVPTGFQYSSSYLEIQMSLISQNGDGTAGVAQLDVHYVIDGKADEVVAYVDYGN